MRMKRIILCILGCILLMAWTFAAAEECTHEKLLMCSLKGKWVDLNEGHQWVETKSCVCDDCGTNLVETTLSGFVGHTFHLSESLHFAREGLHRWVFLCPDCWHEMLIEEECQGGSECLIYKASVGGNPEVNAAESLTEHNLLTNDDYIKRWIAQNREK